MNYYLDTVKKISEEDEIFFHKKMSQSIQGLIPQDVSSEIDKDIYIFLRSNNEIKGGVHLIKDYDHLFLKNIWVDESLQKKGYGVKLYLEVEKNAKLLNCRHILLFTYDFLEALPFWRRMGFQIVGEVPDCPQGHTLYYLKKVL